MDDLTTSHTPHPEHARKSRDKKKDRFKKKAKEKREDAWRRYIDAKKKWDRMSEPERRWRKECDPERIRPKGEPPTMDRELKLYTELDHLCEKMRQWLYEKQDRAYARRTYLNRLEAVLEKLQTYENSESILQQEGWAILHELKGERDLAIVHRDREINLMEQLHEAAARHDADTRAYMLQNRNKEDLRKRRTILANLRQTR